ncbi:hypothetical protein UA08_08879 [Talaromyces atroroseus]|uniref:Transcription factor domain-containing protein n=1 Tax=Talaromyces atroroseus TaxID=1441469 RepID=A0A225AK12_TALAT|nr:hypothetical protein UA08_08879 [Talaromyces atroroseus]OKL55859.1 hypothetical protein UA08_08879 [Talaromyces atroroseus]
MHMVLALSALSLTAITGKPHYYPIALRHKQRTMQLIREQIALNDIAAASNANVIVILMLCMFEISDNCQVSWSIHLSAALDLMRLASRGSSPTSVLTKLSPQVIEFVSRFFLVKDALGRTACGKVAKIKHEMVPVDSSEHIDPSIGCSYELVGVISRITDLSRDMRNPQIESDAWYAETLELEKHIDTVTQRLPSIYFQLPSVSHPSPETSEPYSKYLDETTILHNTSLLIQTSATLYFQATLRSLNPHSARARGLIEQIIKYTRQLSPNHLRSAHLWPLFVGAVYSTGNDEERVWFLDQFDILAKERRALVARGVLRRVKDIVESVWKRRDLDDHCDTDSAGAGAGAGRSSDQERGISPVEIGDWEKYVQPLSEGLCLG